MRPFICTTAIAVLIVVGVPCVSAAQTTDPECGVGVGGANELGGFARLHCAAPVANGVSMEGFATLSLGEQHSGQFGVYGLLVRQRIYSKATAPTDVFVTYGGYGPWENTKSHEDPPVWPPFFPTVGTGFQQFLTPHLGIRGDIQFFLVGPKHPMFGGSVGITMPFGHR